MSCIPVDGPVIAQGFLHIVEDVGAVCVSSFALEGLHSQSDDLFGLSSVLVVATGHVIKHEDFGVRFEGACYDGISSISSFSAFQLKL